MPCKDGKRRRFKTHVEDRGVKAAGLLLYFFCCAFANWLFRPMESVLDSLSSVREG